MRVAVKVLLVVVASSWSANAYAQSEAVLRQLLREGPPPGAPMRYGLLDVLLLADLNDFDLVEEQYEALQDLRAEYLARNKALYAETDALLEGKTEINPEVSKELSRVQGPEFQAQRSALEDEIEERAKAVLLPHQLDLARAQVLYDRLRRYGLRGLLSSDETGVSFKRTPEEIHNVLSSDLGEVQDEIDELMEEYKRIRQRFREELLALQRKKLEVALVELGEDGKKLRQLMKRLNKVEEEQTMPRRRGRPNE